MRDEQFCPGMAIRVIFYAGNPGKIAHSVLTIKAGYGVMISANGAIRQWYLNARHIALDNGAFPAFTNGTVWSPTGFLKRLDRLHNQANFDFAICPDIVAGGDRSLAFSEEWRQKLQGISLYLAVQDGMTAASVVKVLHGYCGLFVGGTIQWKIDTAPAWLSMARQHGKKCHIGRIGTINRLAYCRHLGVDSVDSTTPVIDDQMHIVEDSKKVMILL
jgi:hypothetical protein